ncbi:hypothetical protein JCM8547_005042 [Rhodosporidiobolus lusitaniae]
MGTTSVRPRCPICGTKSWHRDPLSGAIVCEEGHLLPSFLEETDDTQEGPSQHAQTTRRFRKNKGKRYRAPTNNHFHGDRAEFAVWQAMQLIFREQCRIAVDELGWPDAFENIARDLWTFLVVSANPPAAPRDYVRGDEPAGSYSGPKPGDRFTRVGRKNRTTNSDGIKVEDEDDIKLNAELQGGSGNGSGTTRSTAEGAATVQTEDADAVKSFSSDESDESDASSVFSEGGDDADNEREPPSSLSSRPTSPSFPYPPGGPFLPKDPNRFAPPRPSRTGAPRLPRVSLDPRGSPRMESTLLLLYLTAMTMKLPVFLGDIWHLAETQQLPYISAGQRILPLGLQRHLQDYHRDLLNPQSLPALFPSSSALGSSAPSAHRTSPDSVQAFLGKLVEMFREDWGVEIPDANTTLMIDRLCTLAALPPLASHIVHELIPLLPEPFSSKSSQFQLATPDQVPKLARPRTFEAAQARGRACWSGVQGNPWMEWRVALPEVKLASVVLSVAKALWGLGELEGEERKRGQENGGDGEDEKDESPITALRECRLEYASELGFESVDEWVVEIERITASRRPGDVRALWHKSVTELNDDEIEAYLDFFEEKIACPEQVPKRMFTISRFVRPAYPRPRLYPIPSASSYLSSVHSPSPASSPAPYNAPGSSDTPYTRLLIALAPYLLPVPTNFSISSEGSNRAFATTSAPYLDAFVEQLEMAFASSRPVPSASDGEAQDQDNDEQEAGGQGEEAEDEEGDGSESYVEPHVPGSDSDDTDDVEDKIMRRVIKEVIAARTDLTSGSDEDEDDVGESDQGDGVNGSWEEGVEGDSEDGSVDEDVEGSSTYGDAYELIDDSDEEVASSRSSSLWPCLPVKRVMDDSDDEVVARPSSSVSRRSFSPVSSPSKPNRHFPHSHSHPFRRTSLDPSQHSSSPTPPRGPSSSSSTLWSGRLPQDEGQQSGAAGRLRDSVFVESEGEMDEQ